MCACLQRTRAPQGIQNGHHHRHTGWVFFPGMNGHHWSPRMRVKGKPVGRAGTAAGTSGPIVSKRNEVLDNASETSLLYAVGKFWQVIYCKKENEYEYLVL